MTCTSEFSVEYQGRLDIEDHVKSEKHKKAVNAASSANIQSFFSRPNKDAGDKELQLAAKEAAFAYHTAMHDVSFKTSDCTSRLVKKLFEPKFASARTKTEAILNNVISPYILEKLLNDLKNATYITIFIDSSNKKDVKLTPVVVRYFTLNDGVNVKLLYFILKKYLVKQVTSSSIIFCRESTNCQ